MNILLGFILFVSFSISAQVVESNGWWHKTRNWFPVLTALKGSIQVVLPNDPLQQLKRIRELLVHIAESTSSVSKQQNKEELRTELSLLDSRLDSEEEKEEVALTLWFIPVALLPPMHQLPGSTGAAASGGNPGDPNPDPASQESALGPQQFPISNITLTREMETLLNQASCRLRPIKDGFPPNCRQVILSGTQGYGPQIRYALLATIISRFIPPTTKTIPGLKAVNSNFEQHTEFPVIAYSLENSTSYRETPWTRPLAVGVWMTQIGNHVFIRYPLVGNLNLSSITQVGDYVLFESRVQGHVDLPFLTRAGSRFLSYSIISGNLSLRSLTQTGHCFLEKAQIRGDLELSSLTRTAGSCLSQAQISGKLDLRSLTHAGDNFLSWAKIQSNVELPSLTQPGNSLRAVQISGNLRLGSLAQVGNNFLYRSRVQGHIDLPSLTQVDSSFLVFSRISGNLVLSSLTQVGDNFLSWAEIQSNVDLRSITQAGDWFLYEAAIRGNVDLRSLTQTRSNFWYHTRIRGHVDLRSLPSHRRPNITYGWFDTCAFYWSECCELGDFILSEYLCSP